MRSHSVTDMIKNLYLLKEGIEEYQSYMHEKKSTIDMMEDLYLLKERIEGYQSYMHVMEINYLIIYYFKDS